MNQYIQIKFISCNPSVREDCFGKEEIKDKMKALEMKVKIFLKTNFLQYDDIDNPFRSHIKLAFE